MPSQFSSRPTQSKSSASKATSHWSYRRRKSGEYVRAPCGEAMVDSGQRAQWPSGEAKLGSFSGISAEILEAQEGSMPGELTAHDPQVYMGGKSCAYTQASTWELMPDLCRSLLHAAISATCLYQKGRTVNDLQREENQSRA